MSARTHSCKRVQARRLSAGVLLLVAVLLGAAGDSRASGCWASGEPEAGPARIILFVADGMGEQHLELLHAERLRGAHVDRLQAVSSLGTLSLSGVTDSAAAATALSTGRQTYNGMLSVSPGGHPWLTLFERGRAAGMRLGLVTTTAVTDATPAAFAAHSSRRQEHRSVAFQYLDARVDVILGGGRYHWVRGLWDRPDQVAPLERARSLGYAVFETGAGVQGALASRQGEGAARAPGLLLGLFSDSSMAYEAERRRGEPSLADMTRWALEWLDGGEPLDADGRPGVDVRPDGDEPLGGERHPFLLIVEAGRIDHLGHEGRMELLARELEALDDAVGVAMEYARRRPGTAVILTADHETGGLERSAERAWSFRRAGGHTDRPVPLLVNAPYAGCFEGARHLTDAGRALAGLVDARAGAATSLTTMTFNVHKGIGSDLRRDPERLLALIGASAADLVALNEVEHGREGAGGRPPTPYLAEALDYHWIFAPAIGTESEGFGNALLSRFPIREWEAVPLPVRPGAEPRSLLRAVVDVAGIPLTVLVTHLSTPSEGGGLEQAQAIAHMATRRRLGGRGGPAILMGDLNCIPLEGAELAALSAVFVDTWPLAKMLGAPASLAGSSLSEREYARGGYTYDAFDPSRRIDYVFATPGIMPDPARPARVIRTLASDHLPYVVTLRLPQAQGDWGHGDVGVDGGGAPITREPPPGGEPLARDAVIHAGLDVEALWQLLRRDLPGEVERLSRLLQEAGFAPRLAGPGELAALQPPGSSGVGMLVLLHTRALEAEQRRAVERFVEAGGALLAVGEAALEPSVRALAGIRMAGWQAPPLGVLWEARDAAARPLRTGGLPLVRALLGSQVVARWHVAGAAGETRPPADWPLVVVRGRVGYDAGILAEEEVVEDPASFGWAVGLLRMLAGRLPAD